MKQFLNLILTCIMLLVLTFGAAGITPARAAGQPAFAAAMLGTYPATSVALSGDATITPDAVPTATTRMIVATSTDFKGAFVADPTSGGITVTNAHPAGVYTVTVTAFGGTTVTTTFTLTVTTGALCTGTCTFLPATDVGLSYPPGSVSIGDFNLDGKQDIAVPNWNSTIVKIWLGNGTGGFGSATTVSVGANPGFVATGDFNRDGKPDIAVSNAVSDTVSIRLGDGLGGFSGSTNISVGDFPASVVVGDFNQDGKQDFAAANVESDTVSIRLGDGLGGFSGTTEVSVGISPTIIVLGDFNKDKKQDFIVSNMLSNTVSIRLGDGLGRFSGTTNISVGGNHPISVALGDFNGDGKQDFVTTNMYSNTVSIGLGDGLGGFGATTVINVGASPESIAIGDFNRDGKQDFAVANTNEDTVFTQLGDGLGGFSGTTSISVGDCPNTLVIGDFNQDGWQDFATANFFGSNVSIRLGSGIAALGVTLNQAAGQADPATAGPIHFTAVFSEGVTGFTGDDVDFSGTTLTGALTATVTEIAPNDGTTYDVAITGMIPKGTVFVSIPADKVNSISRPKVLNTVSTSADNQVLFDYILVEFGSTASKDGWLLESSEESGVGGNKNGAATTLSVGDDGKDRQYRSVLDFSTAGLPDNAVIYSVNLRIIQNNVVGTNPFTTHGKLRAEIKSDFWGAGAGLENLDFQAPIDMLACDFEAVPEMIESLGTAYRCIVLNSAFPYISRTSTTQLRLRFTLDDNDDMSADLFNFYSGNFSNASQRPRLFIKYYIPPMP